MNRVCLVCAGLAFLPSCIVEADAGAGPPPAVIVAGSGALVVDWSIDGRKDPGQCVLSDAASIDIIVTAQNGAPSGEFQQSCTAFATSIELAPGSYFAEAVLLDSAGRDRTTAVHIRPFDIFGDDELSIPIDFGAGSFYRP